MQFEIQAILEGHQLVPVVTFNEGDDVLHFADYLSDQGVNCIEITLRTAYGLKAIEILKKERPHCLVGAGTVTTVQNISDLKNCGVDFMVSPGLTPVLLEEFQRTEIPYLPGIATPSEVMFAKDNGLDTLKFFPANLYGGSAALKAFGQLFPTLKFCPTGGITKQSSNDYLSLSNVFAVGGSWFQKDYQTK